MKKEEFKNMPFSKKWEHYWFYYKWHTIIGLVALIVVVYSVYGALTQTKYDFVIDMVCSDVSYDIAERMGKTLENTDVIKDVNGDGEKHVLTSLIAFSSEGDNEQDIQQMQAVQVRMLVGESTVMLVGSTFITGYSTQGVFADITHIADKYNIPEDARFIDENGATLGIKLHNNKFMYDHGTPAEDSYIVKRNVPYNHQKDEQKLKEYKISDDVIEYILNYEQE